MDFFCWRTKKSGTFHLVPDPKRERKNSAADERAPLRCNKKYPHGFFLPCSIRRCAHHEVSGGDAKGEKKNLIRKSLMEIFFAFLQRLNAPFIFLSLRQ